MLQKKAFLSSTSLLKISCNITSYTDVSPEGTIGLNLGAYMYIGGVDPRVRVSPVLQLDNGFDGCITEVCALYSQALHVSA